MPANPRVVSHARAMARKYGIDEGTFLKVLGHEGLNVFDPSKPDRGGDDGSSFGPAQLHYAGLSKKMPNAGLGDEFTRRTGLDARDPSTWPQQLEFAAQWASKKGWGDWMGAKAEGITGMMGIGGRRGSGGGSSGGTSAMKFPYRLVGGATRPDAISGFNPAFNAALMKLYNAAPPEVRAELGLNSGYRSNAKQRELFEKSDKTGHTVAFPKGYVKPDGTIAKGSRHEHGDAADLFGFGLGQDRVSAATKDWVHKNAGQFGLYFPMSYEPWHIQMRAGSPTALRHVGGAGSGPGHFTSQYDQETTATVGGDPGVGTEPGVLDGIVGPELTGEDKDKPLGGLMEAMQPQQQQPMQNPLPGWGGGGGAQGGGLAEYIQQYLASRMVGGKGGQGGQGIA